MDGTISALCQRLAQHLLRPGRTGGNDHHFATVLLLLAESFFERVSVRLVHFVRNIFANPGARFAEL